MYGQTNCFVLPEGKYGVYAMKDNEYFIMSKRAARNFAFQEMTKEKGKYPSLAEVTGKDLIGMPLKAPLTKYEKVYALPMKTISMDKGTGIVTSVPSDSPDDYAALRDLQTKASVRDEFNVKPEHCNFQPIPIITIPGFDDDQDENKNMCAVQLVIQKGITSQTQKTLLQEAKDEAYKKGFYEGKMIVGVGNGLSVQEAKPICKQYLFD